MSSTQYLYDIAKQYDYMLPWAIDCNNKLKGKKIFYAIDSNVLVQHTNPLRHIERTHTKIFHEDSNQVILSISDILTNYLFNELIKKQKTFISFHQTASEVQNLYYTVGRKSREQYNKSESTLIDFTNYLKEHINTNDINSFINSIFDQFKDISELFFEVEGTPLSELKKFSNILSEGLITTPEYLVQEKKESERYYLKTFVEAYKGINQYRLEQKADEWFDRLDIMRAKRFHSVDDDQLNKWAEILSIIEIVNSTLKNNRKNAYVVFLTFSDNLLQMASEYTLEGDNNNFSAFYLRHPKAFLAEPSIKLIDRNNQRDSGGNLFEWFMVPLGPIKDKKKLLKANQNELETITTNLEKNDPDCFNEINSRWTKISQNLKVDGWLCGKRNKNKKIFNQLIKDLDKQSIKELLHERALINDSKFFDIAVNIGNCLIMSPSLEYTPTRSIPPLRFEQFNKTQKFIDEILNRKNIKKCFTKKDKERVKVLKEEDDSGYSYMLAVGLFFFSVGRWRLSRILSYRALLTAKKKWNDKNIFGHEAAYLLAVSKRLTIKFKEDLNDLLNIIEDAYDRVKKFKKDNNHFELRYEHERCAIWLTYRLFEIFPTVGFKIDNLKLKNIPTLYKLQFIIYKLIEKCKFERKNLTQEIIQRQLYANYFLVVLIRKFKLGESMDEDLKYILKALKNFNIILMKTDKQQSYQGKLSYRVWTIYHLSICAFCDKDASKTSRETLSKILLTAQSMKKNCILPYDMKRYSFFKEVLDTILG